MSGLAGHQSDEASSQHCSNAGLEQRIHELEAQLANHSIIATRLQLQYQVAGALANADNVDQAMPAVLQAIATIKKWNVALAWVSIKQPLDHFFQWCEAGADTDFIQKNPELFGHNNPASLLNQVMQTRQLVWLDECTSHEHLPVLTTQSGITLRNLVAAPLLCGDTCYGVIVLLRDFCRTFHDSFHSMYRSLGQDIGRFIEAQRYQLELHESNARLSHVQRIGKIGYWEWNLATGQLFGNDGAVAALQRPRNQLPRVIDDYLALVPEADRLNVRKGLDRARLNPHETQEFEHLLLSSSGERLVLRIHCRGQLSEQGLVQRVTGSVQNVTEQRRAEQRLQANEKLWEFVFRSSPVPGLISDNTTGEILAANEEFLRWAGMPASLVIGRSTIDIGLWHSYDEREKTIGLARTWGRLRNHEVQHLIQGELRTALINMEHIELDGRACLFTKYIDITHRKKLESALRLASTAIEQSAEAIVLLDEHGRIIRTNPAFTATTGYTLEEAANQAFDELLNIPSGRHIHGLFKALTHGLGQGSPWKGELWAKRKDGTLFPQLISISAIQSESNNHQASNFVVVFSDDSDRKRYEDELKHRALHDVLTGLPNRSLLNEHLEHALALARRTGDKLAVLFTDLDGFKSVNDEHGHDTGDALLIQVAARLRSCMRESDFVARVGGDEFVVVLQGLSVANDALPVAKKLIRRVSEPYAVNGRSLCVGISVGIALYPDHGSGMGQLLRCADQALYQAKDAGRGVYTLWPGITGLNRNTQEEAKSTRAG